LAHIVGMNMERWFTKGFRDRAPQAIARMTEMFLASNLDGYIACVEAVRDMDFRESNPRITTPTLVIVGKQDPATPPVAGETIAKTVKNGKVVALDAAHISNVEQPKAFTDAALNFLMN
jgi:3-oxoadipate enol-lactonase